jgi:hypothetical protein
MPLTVGVQTYMATNMPINSNYYATTTCIRVFYVQKDFMGNTGNTNLLLLITNTRSMPK